MHLRAAVDKNEDNPTALYHLAQINLDKNRPAPALKRLNDYAKHAPHSPKTLWLGVQISRLMSNPELELRYRNMLSQQFPDSEEYRLMLKR